MLKTPLCWEFIWKSIRERMPIGDATQCDIAWHWFEASEMRAPSAESLGGEREA